MALPIDATALRGSAMRITLATRGIGGHFGASARSADVPSSRVRTQYKDEATSRLGRFSMASEGCRLMMRQDTFEKTTITIIAALMALTMSACGTPQTKEEARDEAFRLTYYEPPVDIKATPLKTQSGYDDDVGECNALAFLEREKLGYLPFADAHIHRRIVVNCLRGRGYSLL